jgi:hypothetical protein
MAPAPSHYCRAVATEFAMTGRSPAMDEIGTPAVAPTTEPEGARAPNQSVEPRLLKADLD